MTSRLRFWFLVGSLLLGLNVGITLRHFALRNWPEFSAFGVLTIILLSTQILLWRARKG